MRQTEWWMAMLTKLSAGHPLYNGRPVAIVITTRSLRMWAKHASHFAVLKNKGWHPVGGRDELMGSEDAFVKEMLN